MTAIVYSGNAYQTGVAFDQMGQVLDIDSMTLDEAMLQIGFLIMKVQTEKVDGHIDDMEKNAKKLEKLNELLGELSELQAIVGSKQTGDMSAFLKDREMLISRINAAIKDCEDPGLNGGENVDLSGLFTRPGLYKVEPPFPIAPLPASATTMPAATRGTLERYPAGKEWLAQYDQLKSEGYCSGYMRNFDELCERIGRDSDHTTVDGMRSLLASQGFMHPLNDMAAHAEKQNAAFDKWWAGASEISNGISKSTPVSEFLAAVKKLEGKVRLCEQGGQEIMLKFNKDNGLLNFATDMVSNYNKALGELKKEAVSKMQSR